MLLAAGIDFAERGLIPDFGLRIAIRAMLRNRLAKLPTTDQEALADETGFARAMATFPIAVATEAANEQHYEVPPEFFVQVLGPRHKYSSCFYRTGAETLREAEEAALRETEIHADLSDGQNVLELGCGWGALTLWVAERFPHSSVTAVSNSSPQRHYIERLAAARGLNNVTVVTADINTFAPGDTFDRIISVEMFEHVSNWRTLLERIAQWLRPSGCLFVHVFSHRRSPYRFAVEGVGNWMGRFFSPAESCRAMV